MENIFLQISMALLVVLGISFIMRILKQPLIVGYILSGILLGPILFNMLPNTETLQIFSQFGIAFLLFIVGLYLNPKTIKEVGKISLITGIGQVVFTSLIGYFIGIWLGFSPIISLYIAVALTFSSTIIIMKLLSDKDALDKLYGKISIGFLLIQDIIAIIILIVVSSLSNGENTANLIFSTLIKGIIIFAVLFPISYFVLPKLSSFFAKSQEFLFVFAISWGLGLSALFLFAGFSIEVGALIAGIMLSMSSYSYEVSSKLKPLRDFFIISFFILLGAQMTFGNLTSLWLPAVIFSLFILIGNPLIVMILMGIFGYNKNTGFMAGLTVAQISEFSLILIALGVRAGHLTNEILSLVTIIGLITIAGSTYMIMYSDKIYPFLSKYLSIFERKKVKGEITKKVDYEYLLFGENRIGFSIMKSFTHLKKKYLVVDFNPERVKRLNSTGIKCIYGDVSNSDFIDNLRIEKAKIIVSTIPETENNLMLLNKIREKNKEVIIIVTARQISDTYDLYKAGANYVILPHFLGGEYTARLIEKAKENKKEYEIEKNKQLSELKERLKEGQEHPKTEKDRQ
ncbi:MAG TPA: cation:proton antiporter [Candidatus Nanoarchaeia archaeon]|nr:cation:proton antiporter [Candidatus Nanoarchaeia archaeon]